MNHAFDMTIYIYINRGGGAVSNSWLDVRKRGEGSFRYVLSVTGGGGLKIGKKCVCN